MFALAFLPRDFLTRLLSRTSFVYFFVCECFVLPLSLLSTDRRKTLGKNGDQEKEMNDWAKA
jgi:hypothetical protein